MGWSGMRGLGRGRENQRLGWGFGKCCFLILRSVQFLFIFPLIISNQNSKFPNPFPISHSQLKLKQGQSHWLQPQDVFRIGTLEFTVWGGVVLVWVWVFLWSQLVLELLCCLRWIPTLHHDELPIITFQSPLFSVFESRTWPIISCLSFSFLGACVFPNPLTPRAVQHILHFVWTQFRFILSDPSEWNAKFQISQPR